MIDSVQRNVRVSLFLIAAAILIGLTFTGCGDGDTAESTTTSSTTEPTTTASTEPTTTVSPATTESTTTESGQTAVEVYFATGDGSDCSEVKAFIQMIDDDVDPIVGAFEALVDGPDPDETAAGASSFFSTATASVVSSVTHTDGLLVVDFIDVDTLIPNASTSCGSESLLAQLNATAFQFESVARTRYLIDGSCARFANWLQRDCFDTDRSGQQLAVPVEEQASGSGCTPAATETLPDGMWFGFVDSAEAEQLGFDLACWFTGSAAIQAAAEDGEESPPPNDYHIRNSNDLRRTLAVATSAQVLWLPDPGDPSSETTTGYDTWRDERADRPFEPGVWLTIDNGEIVNIEEQYVP